MQKIPLSPVARVKKAAVLCSLEAVLGSPVWVSVLPCVGAVCRGPKPLLSRLFLQPHFHDALLGTQPREMSLVDGQASPSVH